MQPPLRRNERPPRRNISGQTGLSPAAERQRAWRRRLRKGLAVYRIEVKRDPLIATLLDSGRLTEFEALNPAKVEAAIAEVVNDWPRRWWREKREL